MARPLIMLGICPCSTSSWGWLTVGEISGSGDNSELILTTLFFIVRTTLSVCTGEICSGICLHLPLVGWCTAVPNVSAPPGLTSSVPLEGDTVHWSPDVSRSLTQIPFLVTKFCGSAPLILSFFSRETPPYHSVQCVHAPCDVLNSPFWRLLLMFMFMVIMLVMLMIMMMMLMFMTWCWLVTCQLCFI